MSGGGGDGRVGGVSQEPSSSSSLPAIPANRASKEKESPVKPRGSLAGRSAHARAANGLPMLKQPVLPKAVARKDGATGSSSQQRALSEVDKQVLRDAHKRLKAMSVSAPSFPADARPGPGPPDEPYPEPGALSRSLWKNPSRRSSYKSFKSFLSMDEDDGKGSDSADGEELNGPHEPPESDFLNVAAKMGMCRVEDNSEGPASVHKIKKSSPSMSSPSPLGLQFKTFESMIEMVKDTGITTQTFVDTHVIPRTSRHKTRYTDLLPEKSLDNATLYVVHCWGCSYLETMTAVQDYVNQLRTNVDDVYVWIDFLCINQHLERTAVDMTIVRDILQSSNQVLWLMDRHGMVFSRMWCLWEAMQAQSSMGAWDKLVPVPTSWCWDDMAHAYQVMDVGRAKTSREKEAAMLLVDMQKGMSVDTRVINAALKEGMLTGARREMARSEKLSSVNPKRFLSAGSAYTLMLTLSGRYGEAESILRTIMRNADRFPSKDVTDKDQASLIYHLASILREQGRLPDAERALQDFVGQFRGMQDELYMEGVAYLVEILTQRRLFTKAEMLTHKALDEKQKMYGKNHPFIARSILQLSQISLAQKLHDECEEHVRDVIHRLGHSATGSRSREMVIAYHTLAICAFQGSRVTETKQLSAKSLELCMSVFGPEHPLTLDAKALKAEICIRDKHFAEAEELLLEVYRSRLRAYGPDHHTTLASMGHLSDIYRLVNRRAECDEMDRRILLAGKNLLKSSKIDKFQSLAYIATFLSKRDHLLDKAAMFLARAFTIFKKKLSNDHELAALTRSQLYDVINKVKQFGADALEHAQLHDNMNQFAVAEVMYKQAYSISKLVQPEEDHKPLAQALADALFGQGKLQEGKQIMRLAGLTRKGMSQNMPASYLRWMNTRVAKYMDQKATTGMFDNEVGADGEQDSD